MNTTLSEVCEPLFDYICQVNRIVRQEGRLSVAQLEGDLERLFREIESKVQHDHALESQFRVVEMPLLYFVDYMLIEQDSNISDEWDQNHRLAFKRQKFAGDEHFFKEDLDKLLATPDKRLDDCYRVFFTCLAMGFRGCFKNLPDQLRPYMLRISEKVKELEKYDLNLEKKVCFDAYEHVDTRDFVKSPVRSLWGIGLTLIGLVVILIVAIFLSYENATNTLNKHLTTILEFKVN